MQKYTEIPSSTSLADSLPLILNNDKTAISCHAGNAFPNVNTWAGMLCYREDQQKLYQLADVTATDNSGWKVIADLSGDARNLDGGSGNTINYDKNDLNNWDNMPTGFYQGTNMLHAPSGDTAWRVLQIREGNSDGYASQLAFSVNSDKLCFRKQLGGSWSDWQTVWTGTDGVVVTGLNADKVDGKEPGNASGNIPINNGTLNTNLNADKLDGYDAGNGSSSIPINNGILNSGLNADQLDGYHAGNAKAQIPINNGSLNTNLNAEMIGGVKIDGLLQVNSSNNIERKINSATFNMVNFTRAFTASTQGARALKGSGIVGTIDATSTSGSGDLSSTSYVLNTVTGVPAGTYDLHNIIQRLINMSHYHTTSKGTTYYKCDCDCNCDCTCDCSDGDAY